MAIDIFNELAPPEADGFISLPDLKSQYGDPFAADVPEIFIVTKAQRYVPEVE